MRARSSSAAGSWGTAFATAARRPRPRRRRSPAATRSRRARSARPAGTRATSRTSTSTGSTRRRSRTRRSATPTSSSSRCRAARSARSSRALPGDAPVLSLAKGLDPVTGERLSTLVARPAGRGALGPELRRGGRRRAARARRSIASEDEALAAALQEAVNSPRLPRLRERRPRRRRAVRGREERDRARRGRRGRARRWGTTRKAALITRGLAEMARLGEACGAAPRRSPGSPGWAT